MPDISDQIDKISTQIANKVSIAHQQVVDALMELVKGKSAEQAATMLQAIDIKELMKLKLIGVYEQIDSGVVY